MYRESEAQTDPFSPDYYIADDCTVSPPELDAVHVSYRNASLPAGLEEIEELARMQKKREFEASLPPTTDPASLKKRFMMIEENEAKEWAFRQQQLKDIQEKRLNMIIKEVHARNDAIEAVEEERLDQLRERKRQDVERAKSEIQRKHIKMKRKMSRSKIAVQSAFGQHGGSGKRDIISEYASFSSEVYAPRKRDGASAIQNNAPEAETDALQSLEGFRELEARFPDKMLIQPGGISAELPGDVVAEKYKSREGQKILSHLKKMEALLKQTGNAIQAGRSSGMFNQYMNHDVVVRPPTPSLPTPRADGTQQEALASIQAVIRGRAAQVDMHLGREARMQLIEELRTESSTRPSTADASTGVQEADLRAAAKDLMVARAVKMTQ